MAQDLHLDQLLQTQELLLEQVAQILQSEFDALLVGGTEQLPELAGRKMMLCEEIERLEHVRIGEVQIEAQGSLPTSATQASLLVDRSERMRKIHKLTQAVARANQRNGMVVSALLRSTQGALDILRGIPSTGGESVYGPYGQSLAGRQSAKPLASA